MDKELKVLEVGLRWFKKMVYIMSPGSRALKNSVEQR
jgi:hypothetical protein